MGEFQLEQPRPYAKIRFTRDEIADKLGVDLADFFYVEFDWHDRSLTFTMRHGCEDKYRPDPPQVAVPGTANERKWWHWKQ